MNNIVCLVGTAGFGACVLLMLNRVFWTKYMKPIVKTKESRKYEDAEEDEGKHIKRQRRDNIEVPNILDHIKIFSNHD